MPQPIEYTKDPLLTRIAKSFSNKQFIADEIFPRVPVESERGDYYVYDTASFRIEKDLRSGIMRANRVDYGMSLASYGPLLEHSLEQGIPDREKRIMGEEKARRNATNNVMNKIMLNHEKMVADILRSTSIVTQNVTLAGNDQWDVVHADSNPFADIQTALDVINATGIAGREKVLILGYTVWTALRNHALVIARLGDASLRTPASNEQLAALFNVDRVIVGSAMYDSAAEGQTPVLSYIWGNDAIVAQLASNPEGASLDEVNPGYTLTIEEERYVDRWDDRANKSEFVRASDQFEPKLVAVEAVYLIKAAV